MRWVDVRDQFVENMGKALLSHVTDNLLDNGVLNADEAEKVKLSTKPEQQAKALIDSGRQKAKLGLQAILSGMLTWQLSP